MRHARHDAALEAAKRAAEANARDGQRYIIVVYDGPQVAHREASYDSNCDEGDMRLVLQAVVDQSRAGTN